MSQVCFNCPKLTLSMRVFGHVILRAHFGPRQTHTYIYIYYIPPPLTVHFSMTRSVRYQPILHTLYYTLHTEHAYCLSYRFLNEIVEILDGRLGKRSVERVRYVINNLLHLVIVKYGVISLVLCISTRLRLVTILSLLVKYLVIFHANPCNKSYIYYIPPPLTVHFPMTHSVRYQPILEKWFPLRGERAHCLKLFCMYDKRFEISKTK